jgi:multiple sugar transport system substrate-binding protein
MSAAGPIALRGLTWDHRRAVAPMAALNEAFAKSRPGVSVEWVVRPLSDFEHQPIRETAAVYDLVILDHPFVGDIAEAEAFLPLEERIPDRLGPDADALYVGPSLASYRYDGHVWAAPIDAATPHGLCRPDLLRRADEVVPTNWQETVELGRRLRGRGMFVAIAVTTPHAFAAVASLMTNIGRPIGTGHGEPIEIDRNALAAALDAVAELLAYAPPETLGWNSIAVHEQMQARDDVAFSPCVYGYATHGEADHPKRLAFSDFCGIAEPFAAGSMLGGTGLAVSAFSRNPEAALAFVEFCLTDAAQRDLMARHHGQPALKAATEDAENGRIFNGYFSSVRRTMDLAWVRPRWPGYTQFQAAAGLALEQHLKGETDRQTVIAQILELAKQAPARAQRYGIRRRAGSLTL